MKRTLPLLARGSAHVGSSGSMYGWKPTDVRAILDNRNDPRRRLLCDDLTAAVDAGRKLLLLHEPWWRAVGREKEDDIQQGLEYLLKRNAQVLRKYGTTSGFVVHPNALRNFVMAVTKLALRKAYKRDTRPGCRWDELQEDIVDVDADSPLFAGIRRFVRMMDLERAVERLSDSDRELFRLLYVEQVEPSEICARLGLTIEAFQQRKSRLIKRIREILLGKGESDA